MAAEQVAFFLCPEVARVGHLRTCESNLKSQCDSPLRQVWHTMWYYTSKQRFYERKDLRRNGGCRNAGVRYQ
jgi:hypothetical protein